MFAHELGHAIQARARTAGPTILLELQADCFAGAWAADVDAGGSQHFELTLEALDKAVAGFLELRDGVGTAAEDPAAHGTGFDRIGAFSEGFDQGAARCADYPDLLRSGELVIVEVPFTSAEDFERGGNLPLDELVPLLLPDLENFWSLVFEDLGETWTPVSDLVGVDPAEDEVTCGERTYDGDDLADVAFYCPTDDTIYVDEAGLIPSLNEIGDYAVATEIARQYAYAAQLRLGNDATDAASNLQADCFTGVYAYSGFAATRADRGQELFLSPGDLDESVIAFLRSSEADGASEADSVGSAFLRFDAFRDGFLLGVEGCAALRER